MLDIFAAFLRLGLTSFGGPVAHLGYFRAEFVGRRRWLDDGAFAELVALCQFLPGPASSQVGFAIGLMRGGALGGLAAWVGFTGPSAILMVLAGLGVGLAGGRLGAGLVHGLMLAAVAVVAQAVWGMARALAPDRSRAALAVLALASATVMGGGWGQLLGLVAGAAIGGGVFATAKAAGYALPRLPISRAAGVASLAIFVVLLLGLPAAQSLTHDRALQVAAGFYQSGAMVFGGGHVVLPLLQARVVQPGWVDEGHFLSGYAMAQALPGPLFTFAAYLGAITRPGPNGVAGAIVALIAIFLPGLLLLIGVLPFWRNLSANPRAQGAMRGANAAVVGLLAAALYNPVWVDAVATPIDFLIAAAAFVALTVGRTPPIAVVAACAVFGLMRVAV